MISFMWIKLKNDEVFFNDLDNEIKLVTSHRQVIDEKERTTTYLFNCPFI